MSDRRGFNALMDEVTEEFVARRSRMAKALSDEPHHLRPDQIRAAAAASAENQQYIKSYIAQLSHRLAPVKPALILQRPAATKEETMAKALSVVSGVMDRAMVQHAAGQITGVEVAKLESISNRVLQTVRARLG